MENAGERLSRKHIRATIKTSHHAIHPCIIHHDIHPCINDNEAISSVTTPKEHAQGWRSRDHDTPRTRRGSPVFASIDNAKTRSFCVPTTQKHAQGHRPPRDHAGRRPPRDHAEGRRFCGSTTQKHAQGRRSCDHDTPRPRRGSLSLRFDNAKTSRGSSFMQSRHPPPTQRVAVLRFDNARTRRGLAFRTITTRQDHAEGRRSFCMSTTQNHEQRSRDHDTPRPRRGSWFWCLTPRTLRGSSFLRRDNAQTRRRLAFLHFFSQARRLPPTLLRALKHIRPGFLPRSVWNKHLRAPPRPVGRRGGSRLSGAPEGVLWALPGTLPTPPPLFFEALFPPFLLWAGPAAEAARKRQLILKGKPTKSITPSIQASSITPSIIIHVTTTL